MGYVDPNDLLLGELARKQLDNFRKLGLIKEIRVEKKNSKNHFTNSPRLVIVSKGGGK